MSRRDRDVDEDETIDIPMKKPRMDNGFNCLRGLRFYYYIEEPPPMRINIDMIKKLIG